MITLSDDAVKEVKRVMEDASYDSNQYLRVGVAGGGCAGFDYKLSFVDKSKYAEDVYNKYNQDGITVIVDKKSELYIDGTTIDWYNDLMKQGFTFNNPNANRTCGCGESFSV